MKNSDEGLVNRNVMLNGHRTSMRMPPGFWDAARDVCEREGVSLPDLIRQAVTAHPQQNHSNAVRCYLLDYFRLSARRRVVIGVEGGIVQGASADGPCDIVVLDYDAEGEDAVEVPQENGSTTEAWRYEHAAVHDKSARAWVKEVHEFSGVDEDEKEAA